MSVNIVNKSTGALTKIAGNPVEQASGISYDHTSSGMSANNVQAAVDELRSGLTNVADKLHGSIFTYVSDGNTDHIDIPATPGARYIVLLNTMGSSGINGFDTVIFTINAGYNTANFNSVDIITASNYVKEISYDNYKYIIKEKKVSEDTYGAYLKALVIKTDG